MYRYIHLATQSAQRWHWGSACPRPSQPGHAVWGAASHHTSWRMQCEALRELASCAIEMCELMYSVQLSRWETQRCKQELRSVLVPRWKLRPGWHRNITQETLCSTGCIEDIFFQFTVKVWLTIFIFFPQRFVTTSLIWLQISISFLWLWAER